MFDEAEYEMAAFEARYYLRLAADKSRQNYAEWQQLMDAARDARHKAREVVGL